MVEDKVHSCHSCTITGKEPSCALVITEAANTVLWKCGSMDFGSFPYGRLTAVLIDSHSKFPVVELIESTAFKNVRRVLDKTFALLGCPHEVKTDNGTLNRVLHIAVDQSEDLECCLQQFLKAYRQTPHSTTGCAPSDLLMKRDLWEVIPAGPTWRPAEIDIDSTQEKRKKTNDRASLARKAIMPELKVGDPVIVKDRHPGWKFRMPFESEVWR